MNPTGDQILLFGYVGALTGVVLGFILFLFGIKWGNIAIFLISGFLVGVLAASFPLAGIQRQLTFTSHIPSHTRFKSI